MKDLTKFLLTILLVLCSVAVIVIAFIGIYVPKQNKLKNIIPEYKLGSEIDGIIEYRFIPDASVEEKEVYVDSKGEIRGFVADGSNNKANSSFSVTSDLEETKPIINDTGFSTESRMIKVNQTADLTEENFEKSKQIIEDRLEKAGATEYSIRLDKKTGNMVIELSRNDDISYLYEVALTAYGEFDIIDYQTGVVLMDKSHLIKAQGFTNLNQTTGKYDIYLQVTIDEEGRNIIKEISKQYIKYTDSSGEEKTDRISIRIDGATIMSTYFGEEYDQAVLNIPIANGVDASEINTYSKSIENIAYTLNQDTMPVKYVQDGGVLFIESSLSDKTIDIVYWTVIAILIICTIVLSVLFKKKGLLAGIMNACLIGLVILTLKYVKVVISISSLVALYGVIGLNILFIVMYLRKLKNKIDGSYIETLKDYYSITFPLLVISFVYTFFVSATVTGLGSVLFWGMLLQIIYNTIVVKYVLEEK